MFGTVVETAWLLAVVACTALVIYGGWLVAWQSMADAHSAADSSRVPNDLPKADRAIGVSVAIVKAPAAENELPHAADAPIAWTDIRSGERSAPVQLRQ